MTIEQNKQFVKGRDYWQAYINLNGYAFSPTDKGIARLHQQTNVPRKELRACINAFLEA